MERFFFKLYTEKNICNGVSSKNKYKKFILVLNGLTWKTEITIIANIFENIIKYNIISKIEPGSN